MKLFKKNGGVYKAFTRCPNCYYPNEVVIPRGKAVAEEISDLLRQGKFVCDNCQIPFRPETYTTEWESKSK